MTKQHLHYVIACAMAITISACTTKPEHQHETEVASADEWPQMDEFHMIMAESFHPFRDSADISPAKANADSMVALADKWLNGPIPSKVDNEEVKEMLQNLKTEANKITNIANWWSVIVLITFVSISFFYWLNHKNRRFAVWV